MDFYNRLNYSLGNEDWYTEEQALRVKKNDRILCVTASGDRPLHLLLTDCSEIISLDMNRIQNFLLELKLAALSALDYEKYLAFLGCTPTKHRYALLTDMKSYLSKEAFLFWENNKKMIDRGIIYQGKVERLTYLSSKVLNLFHYKKIKTLFSFTNLEEQRFFIKKKWDTLLWRKLFDIVLNPMVMKRIINDPGVISYVDASIKPGHYIYQRMLYFLNHNLARKSALLQLILLGKILPDAYFPYLTYEGHHKIRQNTHRLIYKTANVVDYIHRIDQDRFDCFSMSDIASYMTQQSFNHLLRGIHHASNEKARFCLRKLMSNHVVPAELMPIFKRDVALEKKLENEESNFVYRFMVGDVQKL